MEEIHGPFIQSGPSQRVMERKESPVRLGIVSAQLLPEDPVTSWSGQKAALSLCSTRQLDFLNLNSHLHAKSIPGDSDMERISTGKSV